MTDSTSLTFSRVAVNGIHLNVGEAGPKDGPLAILLHGFPEFWYGWRHQIQPLADAGFHVVVPDQRGYNLSDKPKGVREYDLDKLSGDVIALADGFGAKTFFLAGHDWGAIAGWWTAQNFPDRVAKFAAFSAGHPAVWRERMETDPEQKKKSRYVKMFAIPWLPEMTIRRNDFAALAAAVRQAARPDAVNDADLARYREAWGQKGAITATVNWYRAILRRRFPDLGKTRIKVPVLMIWGRRDMYGDAVLAEESMTLCDDGKLLMTDATHWVLSDEAEHVTKLLIEFFGS